MTSKVSLRYHAKMMSMLLRALRRTRIAVKWDHGWEDGLVTAVRIDGQSTTLPSP